MATVAVARDGFAEMRNPTYSLDSGKFGRKGDGGIRKVIGLREEIEFFQPNLKDAFRKCRIRPLKIV